MTLQDLCKTKVKYYLVNTTVTLVSWRSVCVYISLNIIKHINYVQNRSHKHTCNLVYCHFHWTVYDWSLDAHITYHNVFRLLNISHYIAWFLWAWQKHDMHVVRKGNYQLWFYMPKCTTINFHDGRKKGVQKQATFPFL